MQHAQDPCSTAPLQRWDTDQLFAPEPAAGTAYTRFGSFLSSVEAFDASLYGLARAEAVPLDPHARLLLETTQVLWPLGALRSAAADPADPMLCQHCCAVLSC